MDTTNSRRKPKTTSLPEPMPEPWKEEVRRLIREELTAMQTAETLPKVVSTELAPLPDAKVKGPKNRARNPWERVKLGVTVDKALFDLLEAKRAELGDVSLSRAVDTILWHYFDRPALSFQGKAESDPEPAE